MLFTSCARSLNRSDEENDAKGCCDMVTIVVRMRMKSLCPSLPRQKSIVCIDRAMAAAISKRQQARSERALQDMTKTVSGNDRCADCAAKNPGWASWNLGIFLCMRCAALHRKLGTHISKVKSLSMDTWSTEQVDHMKKNGNLVSNQKYNPKNTQPSIPVDVDEVDAAIEKFIRLKYEKRGLMAGAKISTARQITGSTGTDSLDDEPPPLPPKPTRKLGFNLRSTSAAPRSSVPPPASSSQRFTVDETGKSGKPGHLFGMRITSIGNNFDQKLNMLKEMGFPDAKQNQDILKNADGNLDRAVETLTRLGEGEQRHETRVASPKSCFSCINAAAIEFWTVDQ
ncbi:hypothetical protein MRB53_037785 [Persea americana]|nr:hypothetical protein MRB53_037785 [Persea americana]